MCEKRTERDEWVCVSKNRGDRKERARTKRTKGTQKEAGVIVGSGSLYK